MKTNEDKDMKPTAKYHKYPKFLSKERSSLSSPSFLEQENFKVWTEVEVGIPIFWWEIFPYLESSMLEVIRVVEVVRVALEKMDVIGGDG